MMSRKLIIYPMTMTENAKNTDRKQGNQIHWLKLGIAILGLLVLTFGLAYLFQTFEEEFKSWLGEFGLLAYLIVFGSSLIGNLTIIAPVPFAASIMIAAAGIWNPVLIALFAGIGGSIGELSAYYAGYLGKKIAISENVPWYSRIEQWIQKYGVWTIPFLALQPIIPFDIAGLIAGAAKMPLRKFLPALFVGKFLKYIILVYAGTELTRFIPFWPGS
jgi:uncharacterized membrane protein YdjX (TVP38/TMEM64 family)